MDDATYLLLDDLGHCHFTRLPFLKGSVHAGVPFPSRASRRLFTSKILTAGGTVSYCSISQKVLKGAAARVFMYWLCVALLTENDVSLHGQCCGQTLYLKTGMGPNMRQWPSRSKIYSP